MPYNIPHILEQRAKKMLHKIQCCLANSAVTLSLLLNCCTAAASMQQCTATDDLTLTPPALLRYCHYRCYCCYCRCQAITTAVLSPLPCYCCHPIATLLPRLCLCSCHQWRRATATTAAVLVPHYHRCCANTAAANITVTLT